MSLSETECKIHKSWNCVKCTFNNINSEKCTACETVKPSVQTKQIADFEETLECIAQIADLEERKTKETRECNALIADLEERETEKEERECNAQIAASKKLQTAGFVAVRWTCPNCTFNNSADDPFCKMKCSDRVTFDEDNKQPNPAPRPNPAPLHNPAPRPNPAPLHNPKHESVKKHEAAVLNRLKDIYIPGRKPAYRPASKPASKPSVNKCALTTIRSLTGLSFEAIKIILRKVGRYNILADIDDDKPISNDIFDVIGKHINCQFSLVIYIANDMYYKLKSYGDLSSDCIYCVRYEVSGKTFEEINEINVCPFNLPGHWEPDHVHANAIELTDVPKQWSMYF
jgi:hypothetical protein